MELEKMRKIVEDAVLKTEKLDSMHFRMISEFNLKAQKNIINCFKKYCPESEMVAFLDTTLFNNGKKGYLLGLKGMYSEQFSRIKKVDRVVFDEMVSVEKRGEFDLDVTTKNGETYPVCTLIHTQYFLAFLQAVLDGMNGSAVRVSKPAVAESEPEQDVQALLNEIMDIFNSGEEKKAFELWLPLAEAGNASAQNSIAVAYIRGEGVEKDLEKSIYWLRKSAAQNNPKACSNLGMAYKNGEGVEQSLEEAARWFRRGADLGHGISMNRLGNAYYYGEGVPQDYEEAVKWYELSAAQGYGPAMYFMAVCYGNGEGKKKSLTTAREWAEKAVEAGYEPAGELIKTIDAFFENPQPTEAKVPDWVTEEALLIRRKAVYMYKKDGKDYFKDKETGNTMEVFSQIYGKTLLNLKEGKDYFVNYMNGEFASCSRDWKAGRQETVQFGSYYQSSLSEKEPVSWEVIDTREDRVLLVSEKILDYRKFTSICDEYDQAFMENMKERRGSDPSKWKRGSVTPEAYHEMRVKGEKGILWETSDLRSWLNSTFMETAFSKEEQEKILETVVPKVFNPEYKNRQTKETKDKVFILSIDEIKTYFCDEGDEMEVRPHKRDVEEGYYLNGGFGAEITDYAKQQDYVKRPRPELYWTRTPAGVPLDILYAKDDYPAGFYGHSCCSTLGVRPAMWVTRDILNK